MMSLDQMTENAPLPESELPEILEPDLDQEMVPKVALQSLQSEYTRLDKRFWERYEQNTKLKKDLASLHDENRELRKRIANLIWVEESYNREQAHKATDWFLLLMLGGVLGWASAFIVARLLGWL